jgi:hypothetical protein
MKDLGPAVYYLGIDIQRLPNGRIKTCWSKREASENINMNKSRS